MEDECKTKYYWQEQTFLDENGLDWIRWNLPNILDRFANSYGVAKEANFKIPKVLNYIWVTDKQNPKAIPEAQFNIMIESVGNLQRYSSEWQINLWSNSPLIRNNELSSYGITVKNISEFNNNYTKNLYDFAVQVNNWGMASDFLRYAIIYENGGIYADINFILENPDVLDQSVSKYNFFTNEPGNGFFASSAHHPIIEGTIKISQSNFQKPYVFMEENSRDKFAFTMLTSFMPFMIAKIIFSNRNGNKDIAFNLDFYEDGKKYQHLNSRETLVGYKDNCLEAEIDITNLGSLIPFCPNTYIKGNHVGRDSGETGFSWVEEIPEHAKNILGGENVQNIE